VPLTVEFSPPVTFEGKTEAEIVAAVNAGVRIDPELEVHGERCFGVRLAWGLPKYLWACPHCLAEESIVVSETHKATRSPCRVLRLALAHRRAWRG
jgi:hypothetical protein